MISRGVRLRKIDRIILKTEDWGDFENNKGNYWNKRKKKETPYELELRGRFFLQWHRDYHILHILMEM